MFLAAWLLTLTAGVKIYGEDLASDSAKPNGIVFLSVRYTPNGMLELLDTQFRPGKLKTQLAEAHDSSLNCSVISPEGTVLWEGQVMDPSLRRVEWANPGAGGRLQSKMVTVPSQQFMVRVPLYKKLRRVEFRRKESVSKGNAKSVQNTDRLIGSFEVKIP